MSYSLSTLHCTALGTARASLAVRDQCQTQILSIPREYSTRTKQTLRLQEEENQSKEEEKTQFPGDAGDTRTVTTLDENQDPDNDLVYWPGKSTTVLLNQSKPIFR